LSHRPHTLQSPASLQWTRQSRTSSLYLFPLITETLWHKGPSTHSTRRLHPHLLG
jgi:hypothetical protein